MKVAVAVVFALIANVQTGFVLPAHAPDHPVNAAPALGTAVSVIEVPPLNEVPVGDWVIVPGPTTFVPNENWLAPENVAVIVRFVVGLAKHSVGVFRGMLHALAGDQLTNCAPGLGEAIRVIGDPGANDVPCGL
jgi:hypothetical protein